MLTIVLRCLYAGRGCSSKGRRLTELSKPAAYSANQKGLLLSCGKVLTADPPGESAGRTPRKGPACVFRLRGQGQAPAGEERAPCDAGGPPEPPASRGAVQTELRGTRLRASGRSPSSRGLPLQSPTLVQHLQFPPPREDTGQNLLGENLTRGPGSRACVLCSQSYQLQKLPEYQPAPA